MKVMVVADLHITFRNVITREDSVRVLRVLPDLARRGRAHAILVAGDTFDARRPTHEEVRAVVRAIRDLAETAPVVVIPGNHDADQPGRGVWDLLADVAPEGVTVCTGPEIVDLRSHGRALPLVIATLPYGDVSEGAAAGSDAVGVMLGLAARCAAEAPDVPAVLVAHCEVEGAIPGVENRLLQTGSMLQRSSLAMVDYVRAIVLGHVHKRQLLLERPLAFYAGSPVCRRHDEASDPHGVGWLSVSLDNDEVSIDYEDIPGRRWSTICVGLRPEDAQGLAQAVLEASGAGIERGDVVRVMVTASREVSVPVDAVTDALRKLGVAQVAVERVVPEGDRAPLRLPEVGKAADPTEALVHYLAAVRPDMPDEERDYVLQLHRALSSNEGGAALEAAAG